MSTRNLAWGVTGGISFLLVLACGETKIRDVGDVDDGVAGTAHDAGSGHGGSRAGSGNDIGGNDTGGTFGGTDFGGTTSSAGTDFGGNYFGGTTSFGGTDFGGNGGSSFAGMPASCFEPPNSGIFGDGGPTIGPQNIVFVDAHAPSDPVKNYADQFVFNTSPIWEIYANFPSSTAATDTAISLPAQLSQVGDNLGQFFVTRTNCAGKRAAGHKLTVEFWWKHGTIINLPTHGVALGTISAQGKAVWFADSAKTYVAGDAQSKRLTNTLNRLTLEHSFAEDDQTDASKVTLGVWLLPDAEFASTFYLGNATWN